MRIERSPLLLNHVKNRGDVRIFVDENKFVVDKKTNCCNSQVIAKSHKEILAEIKSKHPTSVMVFSAVVSNGRIMPPHFTKARIKINTSEYVKF